MTNRAVRTSDNKPLQQSSINRKWAIYSAIDPDYRRSETEFTTVEMDQRQQSKHEPVYSWAGQQIDEDKSSISTSPTMRRGTKSLTRHLIAWAPEAAWCIVAAVLLGGLVILLVLYNNQPLPDWPLGLTLNTAAALITTALRAVTVLVISEAISQLKWNRFAGQERRLSDLAAFDQASRGPLGSLLMVLRGRGGVLSIAAALVLITGLATSTITQSAISYSTRMITNQASQAVVMKRTVYGEEDPTDNAVFTSISPDSIENVAFQAVYLPNNQPWPTTEPTCSSGHCRWKTFSSLAMCYDMQNVTDKLNITNRDETEGVSVEQNATLTLPEQGDFYLSDIWSIIAAYPQYNILNFTSPQTNFWDSGKASFPETRESLVHANDSDILRATASQWFAIFAANANTGTKDRNYRAIELLWHFCVKTYNVSIEEGKPKVDVLATSAKVRDGQGYGYDIPRTMQLKSRNFTLLSESGDSKFRVFNTFDYDRIDSKLRAAFQGGFSTLWADSFPFNEFSRGISEKIFAGIEVNMTVVDADKKAWENLEHLAITVSDAFTDFMPKKGTEEHGEVFVPETFVRVRWAWLSFAAVQVGLSVAFLISIAWHTSRLGVDTVKSSNMSELFALRHNAVYNQLPPEAAGIRPLVDPNIMAKLEKSDGVWALEVSRQPVSLAQGLVTSPRRWVWHSWSQ